MDTRTQPTDASGGPQFLEMVHRYGGAVGATKHLLADPRHTSYGFQRLFELGELQASAEFAACLPWFAELFSDKEIDEARTRLIVHEFPLEARLTAATASPPEWVEDL
jgi:hypothetical protein